MRPTCLPGGRIEQLHDLLTVERGGEGGDVLVALDGVNAGTQLKGAGDVLVVRGQAGDVGGVEGEEVGEAGAEVADQAADGGVGPVRSGTRRSACVRRPIG